MDVRAGSTRPSNEIDVSESRYHNETNIVFVLMRELRVEQKQKAHSQARRIIHPKTNYRELINDNSL